MTPDSPALAQEVSPDEIAAEITRALDAARAARAADAIAALRASGVVGASIPIDYGGWGLDARALNVLLERLARVDGSLAIVMFQHFAVAARISEWGSAQQKSAVLPRLASGQWLAASAWSETGAGAAKHRLATTAHQAPGGWIIDGAKTFVTGAEAAGIFLVLATTSRDPAPAATYGAAGQSFFLVPADAPGLVRERGPDLVGMCDSATGLVSLDRCAVADDALLGPLGEAARIIASVRQHGTTLGAVAVGLAQHAYELARAHGERTGQLRHDGVRQRLVGIRTRLEAARALVRSRVGSPALPRCARRFSRPRPARLWSPSASASSAVQATCATTRSTSSRATSARSG